MVPRPASARDYTAGSNARAKDHFAEHAAAATEDVRYRVDSGARCAQAAGAVNG
jgi:hypothetical protein